MSSSSSSQPSFSGPFKKAELLLLPQYAASDAFPTSGTWTGSRNHILSVASNDPSYSPEPLYCIIVGMISDNKTYLAKHGSFSSKFSEDAQKAKLQFTLTRPNDPDFGPDFDKAVIAFQDYQTTISETPQHLYFLLKEDSNAMRMNFPLFEPKVRNRDEEREKETRAYRVDVQYENFWSTAKANNYCSIMPVFDTADKMVNPDHFAEKLVGAMCEVTFTLKHYAIGPQTKANGNVVEANDVFSALVESIAILKNPPTLPRSPYKTRLTKRPHHRPQLPTRSEQVNAAAAFVPLPDPEPKEKISTFKTSLPSPSIPIQADTASPSITPLVKLPSSQTITTTHEKRTAAEPPNTADSPFHNLKSAETVLTNNSSSSSSITTTIKPQASSSSVATLPSDENDEIGDFNDAPSPKKLKTKD